jgi:hypothetical protein
MSGKTVLVVCCLALASVMSGSAEPQKHGLGYTICDDPKASDSLIPCDQLPPEEAARQRAAADAYNDAPKRRNVAHVTRAAACRRSPSRATCREPTA